MNKETRIFVFGFLLTILGLFCIAISYHELIQEEKRPIEWYDWIKNVLFGLLVLRGYNLINKSIK